MFGFLHILNPRPTARKFIQLPPPVKIRKEGLEDKLTISQPPTVRLARDFRESVAYSVGILGDQVANLFYYHARQNYNVDPSQLPQGVEKFDQTLRSPGKRSNGCRKRVREKTLSNSRNENRTVPR